MINKLLNSYLFWLLLISAGCMLMERIHPWRKEQKQLRAQLAQDVFFLFFNGMVFGYLFYGMVEYLRKMLPFANNESPFFSGQVWQPLSGLAWYWQFIIILIIKDFLEYLIHYQLHRRKILWQFHQLHHSITIMDWLGNFRFHWMEIIIYDLGKWLPLLFLQADYRIYLGVAVLSTLIGHLNHSNLNISWGKARYILNSPRMHIWHHDYQLHFKCGCNFAVVFSLWDWIFKTAYFPDYPQNPDKLAFKGVENLPTTLPGRLTYPVLK